MLLRSILPAFIALSALAACSDGPGASTPDIIPQFQWADGGDAQVDVPSHVDADTHDVGSDGVQDAYDASSPDSGTDIGTGDLEPADGDTTATADLAVDAEVALDGLTQADIGDETTDGGTDDTETADADAPDTGPTEPCTDYALAGGCWTVETEVLPGNSFYGQWLAVGTDDTVYVGGRQGAFQREMVRGPGESDWTLGGWPTPYGVVVDLYGYVETPDQTPVMLRKAASEPLWDWTMWIGTQSLCGLWSNHDWLFSPTIAYDDSENMLVVADVDGSTDAIQLCAPDPVAGWLLHTITPDSGYDGTPVTLRLTANQEPEVITLANNALLLWREGLDAWVSEPLYTSDFGNHRGTMKATHKDGVTYIVATFREHLGTTNGTNVRVVFVKLDDTGVLQTEVLVDTNSNAPNADAYNVVVQDMTLHPDGTPFVMLGGKYLSNATIDVTLVRIHPDGGHHASTLITASDTFPGVGRSNQIAFLSDGSLLHFKPDVVNWVTHLRRWTPVP